jgi:hypothetical protein
MAFLENLETQFLLAKMPVRCTGRNKIEMLR